MIFLTKKNSLHADRAVTFIKQHWPEAIVVRGERDFKRQHHEYRFENPSWIISYLYPHILEGWFLKIAKKGAINFHPSPYRGAGGPNWAIYNEDQDYTVIAHYMSPKLDAGRIITTKTIGILASDTVYSLYQRALDNMLVVFYEFMTHIKAGGDICSSGEKWPYSPLYTRAMFDELRRITPGMNEHEIERRIKATEYPGYPGAYVDLNGYRFVLEDQS